MSCNSKTKELGLLKELNLNRTCRIFGEIYDTSRHRFWTVTLTAQRNLALRKQQNAAWSVQSRLVKRYHVHISVWLLAILT